MRHGEEPGCLPPRAVGRTRSAGSRPADPRPCSALPSGPAAGLSSDRAARLLPETEPARRADGSPGWAWQGPHEHSRPRPAPTWRRGPGLWLSPRFRGGREQLGVQALKARQPLSRAPNRPCEGSAEAPTSKTEVRPAPAPPGPETGLLDGHLWSSRDQHHRGRASHTHLSGSRPRTQESQPMARQGRYVWHLALLSAEAEF